MSNPPAPSRLDKAGKDKWKKLVGHVEGLTVAREDTLALLCDQWSIYWQCSEAIREQGQFVPVGNQFKAHPAIEVQRRAMDMVLKASKVLGLNEAEITEQDELEDMMSNGDLEDK